MLYMVGLSFTISLSVSTLHISTGTTKSYLRIKSKCVHT